MERKVILKFDNRPNNKALLRKVMHYLIQHDISHEIMRRPENSQSLESFGGLLLLHYSDYEVESAIMEFTDILKSSYKMIIINGNEAMQYAFQDGKVIDKYQLPEHLTIGHLDNEVVFLSGFMYTHLGENPDFLDTTDYERVHDVFSKYDFVEVDYSSHVINMKEACCLTHHIRKRFVEDLNDINKVLRGYDVSLYCHLTGLDAHMNLERIELKNDSVSAYSNTF